MMDYFREEFAKPTSHYHSTYLEFGALSPNAKRLWVLQKTTVIISILSFLAGGAPGLYDLIGYLFYGKSFEDGSAFFSLGFLIFVLSFLISTTIFLADWHYKGLGVSNVIREQTESIYARDYEFPDGSDIFRFDNGHNEYGLTSPSVNIFLLRLSLDHTVLPFKCNGEMYAYDKAGRNELLRQFALQRNLVRGTKITNDAKIRLASDITASNMGEIILQKTDYISSLMTDQIAWRRITHGATVLSDGMSLFLSKVHPRDGGSPKFRIKPLDQTETSNQIGASTIGFTTNGKPIFVRQTHKNVQSRGRIAPSGSGSLDWDDIENCSSNDFIKLIKYGAARELIEECGLHDRIQDVGSFAVEHLHIYAYARMLHRGGKPEFFCVATLPETSDAINKMKVERHEKPFTEKSLDGIGAAIDCNHDIAQEVVRVCRHYPDAFDLTADETNTKLDLSYPLHHGIELLAKLIESESVEAHRVVAFLKTNFS